MDGDKMIENLDVLHRENSDGNQESAFSKRVRELQGVSETANLLARSLGRIERQLLGPRMEPSSDGMNTPAIVGGSLNEDLEMYTGRTVESLAAISDSIQRLGEELGGVSEDVPDVDYPSTGTRVGTGPQ